MNEKITWHYKNFDELTSEELYRIIQLRIEVFMVEQDCLYQECDDKDPKCSHLWASKNNEILVYARIVPPGVSYHEPSFGRLAGNPKYRNLGLGRQTVKYALEIIENQLNSKTSRISAQCYLKNFYKEFGYEISSEEYLEDGLPHVQMLKNG